jgi:hypothetical protein
MMMQLSNKKLKDIISSLTELHLFYLGNANLGKNSILFPFPPIKNTQAIFYHAIFGLVL